MNIVIPMAGLGSRFNTKQSKELFLDTNVELVGLLPKPYIKINGVSMIENVINTLNISGKIILIINQTHLKIDEVKNTIFKIKNKYKNIIIIESDKEIKGTATSALEAEKYIDFKKELLIINSDQFFTKKFSKKFYNNINEGDGTIFTYNSTNLKNSFAILDRNNYVQYVIEKPDKYIDNSFATTGVNFWKKGKSFIEGCKSMVDKKILIKGEYYIAPIYNENILNGEKILINNTNDVKLVGTPFDLLNYIKEKKG